MTGVTPPLCNPAARARRRPSPAWAIGVVLGAILTAGVARAQDRPDRPEFETVPPDPLVQAERRQTQARAEWLDVSRDLERDLLSKPPKEVLGSIARSRDKKRLELQRRRPILTTLIDRIDKLIELIERTAPQDIRLLCADIDQTRQRIADHVARLERDLAGSSESQAVAERETLKLQIQALDELLARLDDEKRQCTDLENDNGKEKDGRGATASPLTSARHTLQRMLTDIDLEQALWDNYYDALVETVERVRTSKAVPPEPQPRRERP